MSFRNVDFKFVCGPYVSTFVVFQVAIATHCVVSRTKFQVNASEAVRADFRSHVSLSVCFKGQQLRVVRSLTNALLNSLGTFVADTMFAREEIIYVTSGSSVLSVIYMKCNFFQNAASRNATLCIGFKLNKLPFLREDQSHSARYLTFGSRFLAIRIGKNSLSPCGYWFKRWMLVVGCSTLNARDWPS